MDQPLLNSPVQFLKGVGPRRARQLERLGIKTVGDVLEHFPRRYEQAAGFRPIAQAIRGPEEIQRVQGRIVAAAGQRPRPGLHISTVAVEDETGVLWAIWFNQPFILQRLQAGDYIALSGKIENRYGRYQMVNPTLEPTVQSSAGIDPFLPVYPVTAGISQKIMRGIVRQALNAGLSHVEEFLPAAVRERHGLMARAEALANLHFPRSKEHYCKARTRMAFEELFMLQLALGLLRLNFIDKTPGIAHSPPGPSLQEFYRRLPFRPTPAQVRVIDEILADMAAERPMHRLLQGDVGAGKTVVAAAALWNSARNGYQALMMAPTEILATQHRHSLEKLLAPWGIRVELLTGSIKAKERERILREAVQGKIDVLVGTHALLEDDLLLPRVSLAITDEQHRFGVRQRARLAGKGKTPDVLVMTATPIPRTLALAYYGDLEVSILDGLPPGRRPVKTYWVKTGGRRRVYQFLQRQVNAGRQAYVVCPVIEDADGQETKAATVWHDRLARALPQLRVGLLHGRMPGREKTQIMEAFRTGEIDVLVATSLIEVGVDVPNATIMVIEDAHRFGLAQLHQLRGRVGRGPYQSYCFLIGDPASPVAQKRLRVLEQTSDGFKVAEEDLVLRGPGELLGTRQHGMPELRVADLTRDLSLLEVARKEARRILADDPDLQHPDHRLLKLGLDRLYRHRVNVDLNRPTGGVD